MRLRTAHSGTGYLLGISLLMLGTTPGPVTQKSTLQLDPESVSQSITRRGPRAVLDELFKDPSAWDALTKGISSGDERWLCIAKRFQGTAEAGGAQELQIAVGYALERNPQGVLRLLRDGFSTASAVCGCEGIEDGLGGDFDKALGIVGRRRAAVAKASAAELEAQRRDCLRWLDRLEGKIRHHERDWFAPH